MSRHESGPADLEIEPKFRAPRDSVSADREPSLFGPHGAATPWFMAGRSVKWPEILLGLPPKDPTSQTLRVEDYFAESL